MHVFTVNFMRFRQTIHTNDTVPSIGPKFFQAIYPKKYRKLDVKINISTRKCPTASLLKYSLGGGGDFYLHDKNGEFYLGAVLPWGIFSRRDFFQGKGGFFQASDQGIFSGGIFTGRLFPVGFLPRTLSIIASRLESKSAAIGL